MEDCMINPPDEDSYGYGPYECDEEEEEQEAMPYEVINLNNQKSHGVFGTLEEARGCVQYDRLDSWEIWEQSARVVAYRDLGRDRKPSRISQAAKADETAQRCAAIVADRAAAARRMLAAGTVNGEWHEARAAALDLAAEQIRQEFGLDVPPGSAATPGTATGVKEQD